MSYPDPPRLFGTIEGRELDGMVVGNVKGRRSVVGFEGGRSMFIVPKRAELRLVYRTGQETTLHVRLRLRESEEARNSGWELRVKALGGRWETLTADLSDFKSDSDQPPPVGGIVSAVSVMVEHPDPSLEIGHIVLFEK